MIEGTVMDQSPAQPNTPAVSADSMTTWMEYVHQMKPTLMNNPPSATGVPVQLMAMASDGSLSAIGTATSDSMGHFEFLWTPPTQGTYKIIAQFSGDDSYWSSSAETALGIGPAPSAVVSPAASATPSISTAPNPQTGPSVDMYIIVAAVIAIIIVVAVAAAVLRRRK